MKMTSSCNFSDILLIGATALTILGHAVGASRTPTPTLRSDNPVDPAARIVIGTDKKVGGDVYVLDGKVRVLTNTGSVNSVDLAKSDGRIVDASDRNNLHAAQVVQFLFDVDQRRSIGLVLRGANA